MIHLLDPAAPHTYSFPYFFNFLLYLISAHRHCYGTIASTQSLRLILQTLLMWLVLLRFCPLLSCETAHSEDHKSNLSFHIYDLFSVLILLRLSRAYQLLETLSFFGLL